MILNTFMSETREGAMNVRSNSFIPNQFCRNMFHKDRRRDYGDNTINTKLPSFNGMCDFKAYFKWEDRMEWVFDRTFYSEQKKVQLAASTFVGDAAEWWDEERHCRRFYGDRPLDTWYELKKMLKERIRQNIDEEFCARMDKIESLFSQWKESSLNLNKVCNNNAETPKKEEPLTLEHVETHKVEESLKTEHVEIPPANEFLSESMENHEEEELELIKHDHESLIEDDEVQSDHEVVCPSPSANVIPNVHTSPTLVLVPLKFTKLSLENMREEKEKVRVKNKSARGSMVRELKQKGKKGVFELMREKKRKKIRKGKRVREKWFVLDNFQVTMARI